MGVISRRVLPACGSLCFCCPELRARSRQPVKRYKKLLADIFPKSQDEVPNDRKIGKLTEYASRNPLRIPKIANALEQRGYKELRSERYGTVRVVMRAYSRLLTDCRDQMPLFATSALGMIKALLEQVRNDDMRILGCLSLVDFLQNQMDSTYVRNVDTFLPKILSLIRETGEESRRLPLRAAGLQVLAAMICFMGKYSQIFSEYEEIVEVILDNYQSEGTDVGIDGQGRGPGETSHNWVQEVLKGEGRNAVAAVKGAISKLYSSKETSRYKDPANLNKKETQLPSVWAQICVQNLAIIAKEASTVRRILDPMFNYFDGGKHWFSSDQGLSMVVLRDMQHFLDKSGNGQLFLPVLVRHLDHKAVADEPRTKTQIVEILMNLARHMKIRPTLTDIGALSDLLRHLRKSIVFTQKPSKASGYLVADHQSLQSALQECLAELVKRVGDIGPVNDMMASHLEKLPGNHITARASLDSLSVVARSIVQVQDQYATENLFSEALLQQLLRAMMHSDAETRVRAHRMFALLLVPSSSMARKTDDAVGPSQSKSEPSNNILARTSSVFSSASALFEKLRRENYGIGEREIQTEAGSWAGAQAERSEPPSEKAEDVDLSATGSRRSHDEGGGVGSSFLSPGRLFGFRTSFDRSSVDLSIRRSTSQLRRPTNNLKDIEMTSVRLGRHQAALLLSVLWLQASLPDNYPANFEAIAHTYMLTLMFSRSKNSGHNTIIRAFQLAFSLRSLALDSDSNKLSPPRRRSIFMLASAMLVFAGQTYGIPQIIAPAKAPLTDETKDPYLDLLEDLQLKVVPPLASRGMNDYGSAMDDREAAKALSRISLNSDATAEALIAVILQNSTAFTDVEDQIVTEQVLQPFVPEEVEELGSQLHLHSPLSRHSPAEPRDSLSFDEIVAYTGAALDEDLISDHSGGEVPRLLAHVSVSSLPQPAIGVSQLLEAALQTAGQVACVTFSAAPLSYSDVASQCQAFGFGSRKKISSVLRLEPDSSSMRLTLPDKDWSTSSPSVKGDLHESYFQDIQLEHPAKDTEEPSTPLLKQNVPQDVPFTPAWLRQTSPEPWQVFRLPPASPYDNFLKAACF